MKIKRWTQLPIHLSWPRSLPLASKYREGRCWIGIERGRERERERERRRRKRLRWEKGREREREREKVENNSRIIR